MHTCLLVCICFLGLREEWRVECIYILILYLFRYSSMTTTILRGERKSETEKIDEKYEEGTACRGHCISIKLIFVSLFIRT